MSAGHDARTLLDAAWPGGSMAALLPVDPVRIARQIGIDVLVAGLGPGESGALVKSVGSDAVIYLNRDDSKRRRRFTCAHEIGHYVKRTNDGELDYEFIDERSQLATTGIDPDEIYANHFAAELLMPEALVRDKAQSRSPVELAYVFDVSEEAIRYRTSNLHLQ